VSKLPDMSKLLQFASKSPSLQIAFKENKEIIQVITVIPLKGIVQQFRTRVGLSVRY
jgi:hypothetical protein